MRTLWCKPHIALLVCAAVLYLSQRRTASADENGPDPRNNFGGVDYLKSEMPSARMAPDGAGIGVGASFFRNNQHYNFDLSGAALAGNRFSIFGP